MEVNKWLVTSDTFLECRSPPEGMGSIDTPCVTPGKITSNIRGRVTKFTLALLREMMSNVGMNKSGPPWLR